MTSDFEDHKKKVVEEYQKHLENNNGMARWDGLYHGLRRVRAKRGGRRSFGTVSGDGWQLAPDEKDLVAALGADWFPKDVNRADLKKRFGLEIKDELAPTITIESHPYRERTDEWGAGAEPYQDDRPLMQRLGITSIRDFFTALFFWHVIIASIPFVKLTSAWQKATAIFSFFGTLVLIEKSKEMLRLSGWDELLFFAGVLYASLPAIAGVFHVMMYKDQLPKLNKQTRKKKHTIELMPYIPFACFQIGGTAGMFLGLAVYIIGGGESWYVLAGIGSGICAAVLGWFVFLIFSKQ